MYSLLGLCARTECNAAIYQQIRDETDHISDWSEVPSAAETHGLGPLLYHHLRVAQVAVPQATQLALQGIYLRTRHANRTRTQVLRDVLSALDAEGVETRIVKGAALSHQIYPEASLRPMSDIDVLVRENDVEATQKVLESLGFSRPASTQSGPVQKSLPTASRRAEGVWVGVEMHVDLFERRYPASLTFADLEEPPVAVPLGDTGATLLTLGYEQALWHLCEHIGFHTTVFQPQRLIWVADIVSFAERYVTDIDWELVTERYPVILRMLSLFHHTSPLSESLLSQAPIRITPPPKGVGVEFQGWPRYSLAAQADKSWRDLLRDTFCPSEWWLRMRYKLAERRPTFVQRWVRHPLHIAGWVLRLAGEKVGWRTWDG